MKSFIDVHDVLEIGLGNGGELLEESGALRLALDRSSSPFVSVLALSGVLDSVGS